MPIFRIELIHEDAADLRPMVVAGPRPRWSAGWFLVKLNPRCSRSVVLLVDDVGSRSPFAVRRFSVLRSLVDGRWSMVSVYMEASAPATYRRRVVRAHSPGPHICRMQLWDSFSLSTYLYDTMTVLGIPDVYRFTYISIYDSDCRFKCLLITRLVRQPPRSGCFAFL